MKRFLYQLAKLFWAFLVAMWACLKCVPHLPVIFRVHAYNERRRAEREAERLDRIRNPDRYRPDFTDAMPDGTRAVIE